MAGHTFDCHLVDSRDFEAKDLSDSGTAGDLALSILANNGGALLRQSLLKVQDLPAELRRRILRYMLFLAGLRPQLSTMLKMELAITQHVFDELNLSENVFFKDLYLAAIAEGEAEGEARGEARGEAKALRSMLHRQMSRKFAPLPDWAQLRLERATTEELELWSELILSAMSLEEILT